MKTKLIAEEKKAKREAMKRGKAKKHLDPILGDKYPPSQETECCAKCGRHEQHDGDEEWVSCDNCGTSCALTLLPCQLFSELKLH